MGSEREKFEEWVKSEGLNTSKFITRGEYIHKETQSSWKAWQATKSEAVPDGFVLAKKELPEEIAEAMALECVEKPATETNPTWI